MSTVDHQNNKDAEERPDASGMGLRLELFAEDMGESTSFYRRVLGFKVIREEPGDYASLRSGDILLGIGPISRLPEREGYFTRGIRSSSHPSKGHGASGTSGSSTLTATICASPPGRRRLESSPADSV